MQIEPWAESRETRRYAVLGVGAARPEKSKCKRLANIESDYDPRTKKKQKSLNVFKSALCQPRGGRVK